MARSEFRVSSLGLGAAGNPIKVRNHTAPARAMTQTPTNAIPSRIVMKQLPIDSMGCADFVT